MCGENTIDLDLLKQNTEYSGAFETVPPNSDGGGETKDQNKASGSDGSHPVVKWLWEILDTFDNEDRSRFVKFASGRTRLSDEKDFTYVLFVVVEVVCVERGKWAVFSWWVVVFLTASFFCFGFSSSFFLCWFFFPFFLLLGCPLVDSMKMKIHGEKTRTAESLPTSGTCFFRVMLSPWYETKEQLEKALLVSMANDDLDGDEMGAVDRSAFVQ